MVRVDVWDMSIVMLVSCVAIQKCRWAAPRFRESVFPTASSLFFAHGDPFLAFYASMVFSFAPTVIILMYLDRTQSKYPSSLPEHLFVVYAT